MMNKIIISLKNSEFFLNLFIILSFVALSLFSVILLLKNNVVYLGTDTQFHFKRIMELSMSLHNKDLLPSFAFNNFHGSSVLTLYPYLNLIPYVILSFIIKSKIIFVYSIVIFNVFMSFIISFYSCKNYIKTYITSYVFSIIYSMSNIFLFYNTISNDFGVVSSYIILPLIIFGFLKLINERNGWIQLSLGMSILFYSHILNLIIVGVFLLMFLIINLKIVNKFVIINLFKSILIFILITSIIWIPFMHLYFTNFNTIHMPIPASPTSPFGSLSNISIKQFMSGLYGSKNEKSIGFFPLITLFISLFFYRKFTINVKQMYILSVIIILSSLFLPWKIITTYEIFKPLNQLQFINRLFIIPIMLLTFICSLIVTKYLNYNKIFITSILVIIFTIVLQLIMGQFTSIKKFSKNPSVGNYLKKDDLGVDISKYGGYPINNSNQFNIILNNYSFSDDDYIPKSSLPVSKYVNRNLGFYNDYHQIKVNHVGYNTFSFSNRDNINKLSLPIYVYNKEKLSVYLNNKPVDNYANENGLLTINDIKDSIKSNNKIYIKSYSNLFRIMGAVLSILGWLFILLLIIKKKLFY